MILVLFASTRVIAEETNIVELRKTAEHGDAEAQHYLGLSYATGEGVSKDLTEAVKWLRKAAEQGNAAAQNSLGDCYRKGEGVPKDSSEAVKWYRKAAENGSAGAQFSLGDCYLNGEGVPQDGAEATKWYRKGAEQRNSSTEAPAKSSEKQPSVCDQAQSGATKQFVTIGNGFNARLQIAPNSNSEILRIPGGSKVQVLGQQDTKPGIAIVRWFKVEYKGKTGWISQGDTMGEIVTEGPNPTDKTITPIPDFMKDITREQIIEYGRNQSHGK